MIAAVKPCVEDDRSCVTTSLEMKFRKRRVADAKKNAHLHHSSSR